MPGTSVTQLKCLKHLSEVKFAHGQKQNSNYDFLIFPQDWCFPNRSSTARVLSWPLYHSEKFSQEPQACTTRLLISCTQVTSRWIQNPAACWPTLKPMPHTLPAHHTQIPTGNTRGWQYWGGQGKGKGCLMQRKDAQVSRALATSSFLPRNISVSPTCNCRITGMIWKCSLVCYSLVLHLRFSGLGRNRWNPVYLTFHSKLARVCCVVGEQGSNPTLRFEEAPPVPLRNVTDIQALEDNSDTLQLMKMIMEVPENLHSTGILQTALSCALPTLQLLSNC